MKILFFYKYDEGYNMDFWLHEGFMRSVSMYPDVKSDMYGPKLSRLPENNCRLKYAPGYTMEQVEDFFKPDVIILNTKSRMYEYYSPPTGGNQMRGEILPRGFRESKTPKVILEEDYHYELNDDWYKEVGISLILQRHKSQSLRQDKVKMLWFPFSVDTETFSPSDKERINKICFTGSMTSPYADRIHACDKLKEENLIDVFCKKEKVGANYVQNLKEYISHLNGASIYDITAAKVFEIASSGSILFTNHFTGLEDLFPNDLYVKWDNDNVAEKARYILNNPEEMKIMSQKMVNYTKENHSHFKRTEQLIKILKENL
jgi:spore maturation protein CgeB